MSKQLLISLGLLLSTEFTAQAQPGITWQKSLGGGSHEESNLNLPLSTGEYIVGGFSSSSNGMVTSPKGDFDFWVTKLDASGNLKWQRSYGGSQADYPSEVMELPANGGYLIVGYTNSSNGDVSGNHGGMDAWVIKTDTAGQVIWKKCYGGSNAEMAASVVPSVNGFLVSGFAESNDGDVSGNHGGKDVWVFEIDSVGTMLWQKCLGGSSNDIGARIRRSLDGNLFIAGETSSSDGDVTGAHGDRDAWVIKVNSAGAILWQQCMGGSGVDVATGLQATPDGGCVAGGYTASSNGQSSANHGLMDYFITKMDASGSLTWFKCYGGANNDFGYSLLQDNTGYVISGQSNSLDGDVDGNHDDFDAWILKTDLSGNPVWNQSYGGTANDGASPLAFTNNGGVIFTGWTSSVDGDITTALGSFDYWVVNLAPVLSVSEVATFEMSVVPNPFSMSFQVHFQEFTSGTLTVFDMTGKRVSNIPVSGKSAVLESGAWQTGYYFLRFDQADGKQHGRLILKK